MAGPPPLDPRLAAHCAQRLAADLDGWLDGQLAACGAERLARLPVDSDPTTWPAAVEPLRERLRDRLGLRRPPPAAPGGLERRLVARLGSVVVEQVRWWPWPAVAWDGLWLRPDDARRPLLLVAHGLSDSPEACVGLLGERPTAGLCRGLLATGYALFVPRLPAGWPTRLRLARKARLLGREWLGLETLAVARLLDRLPDLPSVDPAAIGALGFSRGGQLALLLTALDPRPAVCLVASWFADRAVRLLDTGDSRQRCYLDSPEDEQFIGGWLTDFDDAILAALVAPRPLLVTSGLDDEVIARETVAAAFVPVAALYRWLGVPDRARLELFPGGHEPRLEPTLAALRAWLPAPPVGLGEVPRGRPPGATGRWLLVRSRRRRTLAARQRPDHRARRRRDLCRP